MGNQLPSLLKRCPILNCTCEIRYKSSSEVEQILPGHLYATLPGVKKILPVPSIPPEVIRSAPEMQAIPSFSLEWDGYTIAGNYTYVSISLAKPYDRWKTFREGILQVFSALQKSELFSTIVRTSMKYINFIPVANTQKAIDLFNLEIKLVNNPLRDENIQLRVSNKVDTFIQIINIATDIIISSVVGSDKVSDEVKKGGLIDTDVLHTFDSSINANVFFENKEEWLNILHIRNKELFFSLLTQQTIKMLEPEYDVR